MINDKMAKLLIDQIRNELSAHQQYLAIAMYFERNSLDGWGKLFRKQSVEEAQHATRIMDFLIDNEVDFDMPPLKGATTRYASAADAVKSALDSEKSFSGRFRSMAQAAIEEGDHTTSQFLNWFLEEQVEEESKMEKLLDLVNSGANLFQAELLLPAFE